MNRYDFTQPGGFPFDQGVMAFIQDCITTASKSAALAGPLAILSGCVVTGGSVGAGFVVIDGEILPFSAGLIEAKVIIVQTGTVIAYEDGTPRTTKFERVARFGTAGGVGEYNWADFKRNTSEGVLARIERLEGLSRPFMAAGGMVWWLGADIPAGWREVASMRGYLPMAQKTDDADFATIGQTGGAKDVKMELENLIAHQHNSGSATANLEWDNGGIFRNERVPGGDGTGFAGSADPTPMKVLNPYKVGRWIEPIPGTF